MAIKKSRLKFVILRIVGVFIEMCATSDQKMWKFRHPSTLSIEDEMYHLVYFEHNILNFSSKQSEISKGFYQTPMCSFHVTI